MKIIKNYFWNVSYQLLALIVPIIIIPYINNKLGPSGVGVNSYTNSVAQIFTIIGDLGVANYGTKTIASIRDNKNSLSKTFMEITIMRFTTILISYGGFLLFIIYQSQFFKFYLLQGIVILASIFDFSWFFMGIEDFKIISIRNFIIRITTFLLIFILIKNKNDLGSYIALMSISNLLGNISILPSLSNKINIVHLSFKNILYHLKYAIIFFIPQIAMQIYQTLDKFLIGKIINVNASGYFDNSDKIINMLLTIIGSLSTVVLPHISNIFNKGHIKKLKSHFYKYFDIILALSFPMTAGISSISLKFAPWFFGADFKIVGNLMMIESLTIFIISISLAFSSYFMSTNQVKQYNIAIILGSSISLTIGIYLMYTFGLIGAMWSAVLTELIISIYEMYVLRKQLSFKHLFNNSITYIIGSFALFFVVLFVHIELPFNIYTLIIEVILGIVIYTTNLVIFTPPIFYYIKSCFFKSIYKLKNKDHYF